MPTLRSIFRLLYLHQMVVKHFREAIPTPFHGMALERQEVTICTIQQMAVLPGQPSQQTMQLLQESITGQYPISLQQTA